MFFFSDRTLLKFQLKKRAIYSLHMVNWNDSVQTTPVVLPITRPQLICGSPLACARFLDLEKKYLLDIEGYESMDVPLLKQLIDPELLDTWAEFNFLKPVDSITEAELRALIVSRSTSETSFSKRDMDAMFNDIFMNMEIPDPEWRVEEYFQRLYRLRKEKGVSSCLETEQGKKKFCRFLVNGVRPNSLRYKLEGHIEYCDAERKDPQACAKLIRAWVKDQDKTHGRLETSFRRNDRFHPYADRNAPYRGRGRGRGAFRGRGRGRGRGQDAPYRPPFVPSYPPAPPPTAVAQTPAAPNGRDNPSDAPPKRVNFRGLKCFKCGGPHHLRECPIPTTPQERRELVNKAYKERKKDN